MVVAHTTKFNRRFLNFVAKDIGFMFIKMLYNSITFLFQYSYHIVVRRFRNYQSYNLCRICVNIEKMPDKVFVNCPLLMCIWWIFAEKSVTLLFVVHFESFLLDLWMLLFLRNNSDKKEHLQLILDIIDENWLV